MKYWTGNRITKLEPNHIFVFGSNPEGRHGAGAAKCAVKFGATYGIGRGLSGQTYALVTKNLKANFYEKVSGITYPNIGHKSVSLDQIATNIQELFECANNNQDKNFYIGYQKCSRNLNGYTSTEIIKLFGSDIPSNIYLHESFKVHKIIIAGGRDFTNESQMKREANKLFRGIDIEIVSGMAQGADMMAYDLAIANKIEVTPFKADWQNMSPPCVVKYNVSGAYNALAGMKRNHIMGDYADSLLAFWDGKSKGTKDMIDYMGRLGKPVTIIYY